MVGRGQQRVGGEWSSCILAILSNEGRKRIRTGGASKESLEQELDPLLKAGVLRGLEFEDDDGEGASEVKPFLRTICLLFCSQMVTERSSLKRFLSVFFAG